jgi:hypothetical protein
MSAAVDVFLSAAEEDAAVSTEVMEALSASGITCFSGASARLSGEALAALETGRSVVFVLSAAANAAPDVVRELERAAARGIPIISYAIEDVSPSPSIAYFTATVPPIPAWSGDRQRALRTLEEAARRTLTESAATPERPAFHGTRYSRVSYAEARGLQIVIAALLAISACVNVYALYRDTGFLSALFQGRQEASAVTAENHLGWTAMASSLGVWAVIVSSILVFRRARLNLLSFFGSVQTTASEIVWRPIMPIANAFWMPRIARDLRRSSDAGEASGAQDWPLARYWSLAFLCAYLLVGMRDTLLRMAPQRSGWILGVSTVLGAFQILSTVLTYAVLAQVLDRVRAKQRSRHIPPASSEARTPDTGRSVRLQPDPCAATLDAPPTSPDVLVFFAAGDDTIAGRMASVLEEQQRRCWTPNPAAKASALEANDVAAFAAVFVVVSRASHASGVIAELVRSALAGAAPVIPFVVEPPPSGSTLGHYIRSLHWIDGATGPGALRSEQVRTVLGSTRVGAGAASVTMTPVADGIFSRLQPAAVDAAHYRPPKAVRATARTLAIGQVAAASLLGIIALGIALVPEDTPLEAPLGLSLFLAIASLPAWCAFLVWIRQAHRNARALQVPALGSSAWLLVQAAVPGLSLALGGRAIGRLWAAMRRSDESESESTAVTRFQVAWTAAGIVWTVSAIASAMLGAQGSIVIAMLVGALQCVATVVRGVLRARIIKDVESRLDARARRGWQIRE